MFGWCSWLSRAPHTREVPSSILGSNIYFIQESICGRVVKAPDSSSGQLCWREFDPRRMYFFFQKIPKNGTLFPGGPPPQYWAGSNRVNFGVRMRTGALRLIWSNPTLLQKPTTIPSTPNQRALSGVKAVSYDKIGTIQRRLAWPLCNEIYKHNFTTQ